MIGPIPMLLLSWFMDPTGLAAVKTGAVGNTPPPPPLQDMVAEKLAEEAELEEGNVKMRAVKQRAAAEAFKNKDKAKPVAQGQPKKASTPGKGKPKSDSNCANQHDNCDFWAEIKECEKNPTYMNSHCPKACGICTDDGSKPTRIVEDDKAERCARDADEKAILGAGGINKVYRRLATDPELNAKYNITVMNRDPWIVTLDNFITDEESAALIKTLDGKFERSSSVGKKVDAGTFSKEFSDYRTSYNAWCNMHPCVTSKVTKAIQNKIADVTMTEVKHQEFLQVLQYEPDQYYKKHHDFIPGQVQMPCGPRIFTAFMYFNDVEEGGETRFNNLNISVRPKAGRMLLWSHVKNSNVESMDGRTEHEAMPVIKGTKMAANAWVHLYEFRKYNALGCTG